MQTKNLSLRRCDFLKLKINWRIYQNISILGKELWIKNGVKNKTKEKSLNCILNSIRSKIIVLLNFKHFFPRNSRNENC